MPDGITQCYRGDIPAFTPSRSWGKVKYLRSYLLTVDVLKYELALLLHVSRFITVRLLFRFAERSVIMLLDM